MQKLFEYTKLKGIKGNDFEILVYIITHTDNKLEACCDSNQEIAEATGLDRRVVARAIKNLQIKKAISVQKLEHKRRRGRPVNTEKGRGYKYRLMRCDFFENLALFGSENSSDQDALADDKYVLAKGGK